MVNLLFENIWILSRKSRTARMLPFHHQKNLVVGRNHTGKSSLIKTIFQTLGASPSGVLEKWDVDSLSLLTLSVGTRKFHILHRNGNRALFAEDYSLIKVATSHKEWVPLFASIVSFNLVVPDKSSKSTMADPKCFFLPFYINQDGSWGAKWDTFRGIEQYSKPIPTILEYFTGVKPPEYYKVSADRSKTLRDLEELQKEQRFLKRAWERVGKNMELVGPKLDPAAFESEIKMLTEEVTELNKSQEIARDNLVREREIINGIELQIKLAVQVLKTYESDAKFLQTETDETLTCPTCGAQHLEPFGDILTYAEDARVLRDLIDQLRRDGAKASESLATTRSSYSELQVKYVRVSKILDSKKGSIELRQVLDGMGAEKALAAFESEHLSIKTQLEEHELQLGQLNAQLKSLTDARISKEIHRIFRTAYAAALTSLHLPPVDQRKIRLTSRPQLSGSGGPRQILAYYSALWTTSFSCHGTFRVPLVIDSPNQQGQDAINLPAILDFIANKLPPESQIIICSEIDTNHSFENVIHLDKQYSVLKNDGFSDAETLLGPLEEAMMNAILLQDLSI